MIVPEKAVSYIEVSVIYAYNNGNAYFDNISLTREDVQTYKYNDDGEVVAVNSASSEEGPTYSYDGADLIKEISPTSGTYEYEYNFENNPHLVTKVKNDGLSMEIDYIMAGLVSSTTLKGEGGTKTITTSASYEDYRDHLISSTSELGVTTTYTYGTDGNLAGVTTPVSSTTGTGNVTTSYTYVTNTDKVASVYIDNLTGVAYTYVDGCLEKIIRTDKETQLSQMYTFVYDDWGNTTQIKVGNRTLATYTYADGNGNLETMTYGNGVVVTYEYDKFDRVETVECAGYETRYYYSAEGSLERTEDEKSGRTTYYIYDGIGRLVRSTAYEDGNIVEDEVYCYDDLNRTSEVFTKAGTHENTQSYTYDTSDGSLTKLENEYGNTSDTVTYSYDYLKRLSKKVIENEDETEAKLEVEYTYADNPTDSNKTTTLVTNMLFWGGRNDRTQIGEFNYEYDNLGNITKFYYDDIWGGEYKYDELGQLVEFIDYHTGYTHRYTYDNFGNILSEKIYYRGSLSYTYSYGYTDSNWRDLLTSYRGHTITYDAIGNPLSYYNGESYTFTWEEGRKLATASVGNTNVSYNYENGNRVSKNVNGTVHNYYYVGGNLVSETWGDESLTFLYDESGAYGFIYDDGTTEETYYYGKNLQGDVIVIYDSQMYDVVYYVYDDWGNLTFAYNAEDFDILDETTHADHIAYINPLRYRSYYYDTETSLYFLNSRYYDAKIGRFINCDGYISTGTGIAGYNMYAYCNNNPVMFSDPDGNCPGTSAHILAVIVMRESCEIGHNARDLFRTMKAEAGFAIYPVFARNEKQPPTDYYGHTYAPGHTALDYHVPAGTEIYAVFGGVVVEANISFDNSFKTNDNDKSSYGNYVKIQATDGNTYIYAHMQNDINWDVGDYVQGGQLIGYVGSTGRTYRDENGEQVLGYAHLHLEWWET